MRIISFILLMAIFSMGIAQQKTVHDFSVTDIHGDEFKMSDLAGKKVMIVNTASECGLTPQYEGLEALYKQFKDDNFVIIGFPANNFLNQEPGTNAEIATFCRKNYGVSFPMMSKISVKGDDQHELYKWLTTKELNGLEDSKVQWNFQKYLINPDGTLAKVFSPRTDPQADEIINWITE
ncbi:MAG: glutathione peroxidase [Salinivirgaceae bacterium]|jgi:glutathione peroxidase|nr:glutathione peroxidase [Salinivirgaceae bacterium]